MHSDESSREWRPRTYYGQMERSTVNAALVDAVETKMMAVENNEDDDNYSFQDAGVVKDTPRTAYRKVVERQAREVERLQEIEKDHKRIKGENKKLKNNLAAITEENHTLRDRLHEAQTEDPGGGTAVPPGARGKGKKHDKKRERDSVGPAKGTRLDGPSRSEPLRADAVLMSTASQGKLIRAKSKANRPSAVGEDGDSSPPSIPRKGSKKTPAHCCGNV